MSAHAYTEDQIVEPPAIGLFAELGWTTVSLMDASGRASPSLASQRKVFRTCSPLGSAETLRHTDTCRRLNGARHLCRITVGTEQHIWVNQEAAGRSGVEAG